jgi:hypothetical protein
MLKDDLDRHTKLLSMMESGAGTLPMAVESLSIQIKKSILDLTRKAKRLVMEVMYMQMGATILESGLMIRWTELEHLIVLMSRSIRVVGSTVRRMVEERFPTQMEVIMKVTLLMEKSRAMGSWTFVEMFTSDSLKTIRSMDKGTWHIEMGRPIQADGSTTCEVEKAFILIKRSYATKEPSREMNYMEKWK